MNNLDKPGELRGLLVFRIAGFAAAIALLLVIFASWPFYTLTTIVLISEPIKASRKRNEVELAPTLEDFLSTLTAAPRHMLNAEEVCTFCRDTHAHPVLLDCKHIFCSDCVKQLVEHFDCCPLCQQTLFRSDPAGRHLIDATTLAFTQAYLFLHMVGICLVFGPGYTMIARAVSLICLLSWDVAGIVASYLVYEGFIPGYDRIMWVRNAFGRRAERDAMRVMWLSLFVAATAWAVSLAMALQIAYAGWMGWGWSELEQRFAWFQL